jgi:hypothetical protein
MRTCSHSKRSNPHIFGAGYFTWSRLLAGNVPNATRPACKLPELHLVNVDTLETSWDKMLLFCKSRSVLKILTFYLCGDADPKILESLWLESGLQKRVTNPKGNILRLDLADVQRGEI